MVTRKYDVPFEHILFTVFRDMVLIISLYKFLGEPKVYKEHLGVGIQAFTSIDHYILKLQVIEGPLGAMKHLKISNNLHSNIHNFLNFFDTLELF